jgi:hypothetical protein
VNAELAEDALIEDIAAFSRDPLGYVLYAYDWGYGELKDVSGPRTWQAEKLKQIGEHLSSGSKEPLQVAVASGHGIGKSALIGMIVNWGMSTFEDCRIVVTANTENQLRTKTWPEISKWARLSINAHWWNVTATSITAKDKVHERAWRADAHPWSEQNTEAFAGLHNKSKRIIVIYDEASAIADRIWEVTEGALTDEDTEILWIAFGNPTKNTGRFRECFGKFKHRWLTSQIDSRKVEGTNKAQLQKWEEDWGEDSDFFRIRARGEFPRASSSQFIASDMIARARRFKADGYQSLPKILSVDVARFGNDQTVIGLRQGRRYLILNTYRGLPVDQVAGRVSEYIESEHPAMTVVDGGGVGGGVIDVLRSRGYGRKLHEYNSSHSPDDAAKYANKRAEVWGLMREWLAAGAEIPDDPELGDDLTSPEYFFTAKNQIQLESKDDMKARGLASPDKGDNLAMTFAVKVAIVQLQPQDEFAGNYAGAQGWMA